METKRRNVILEKIKQSEKPISATTLAKDVGVSRQIIVGDIALLRAMGHDIIATPRGYVMQKKHDGTVYEIVSKHGYSDIVKEFYIILDAGGVIEDVTVAHEIYGELTGSLHISSREDVDSFMERCLLNNATPLSALTGGVHSHKIICPSPECYNEIVANLKKEGLIYNGNND